MKEKFINYIINHDVFEDAPDTDFSDPAFAYDYNEVQELYFDNAQNNYVFLVGETGLRKTDMLGRICRDLLQRGIEKEQILYLDYELPFLQEANILDVFQKAIMERHEITYLVVNEIQECGDWFLFANRLRKMYPNIKLLCSSSTPPYIFEKIYDERCEFCKIVVLSTKNASNIKYETKSFGIYHEFKYNRKGDIIEIKGLTKEGKSLKKHIIPAKIDGVPVKVIASGAFHDRSEMTEILIPDGIEMIGDYAFSKCSGLVEINLPHTLKFIGEHAFLGAKNLKLIHGGESVEHIGNSALYDTKWFKDQGSFAILGKTLYKYLGIEREVTLPHGIEMLSGYCFANTKVESVIFGKKIDFPEGIFYNCTSLKHVDFIPKSVPPFAFYNCKMLDENLDIDSIGKFGMFGCSSLKQIAVKNFAPCAMTNCAQLINVKGLVYAEKGALWNCHSLCVVPNDLQKIGIVAFGKTAVKDFEFIGHSIGDYAFYATDLRSVSIAKSTSIGKGIFYNCIKLKQMDIPGNRKLSYYFSGECPQIKTLIVHGDICDDFCRNNPYLEMLELNDVKNFGRWSFYNNSALKTIIFNNVNRIGDWAFAYCDELETIELPAETVEIGMNAFRYCHWLKKILIHCDRVIPFGANAFYSIDEKAEFTVPSSLVEQYKRSRLWNAFKSQISVKD